MTRNFTATDAAEARATGGAVPLLIGLTGPSGSGKTYTALRLATGIQSVVGGDIFMVDTEQRRGLHYSDKFKFKHVPFTEPFGSLDYREALRWCKAQGAGVVIIDSCSHEHDGPGGLLDQHETELDRMAGQDYAKRERVTMLAWQKPKSARRKLITAITTELQMPIIFCFRAKTTTKPMKVDGKLQPVDQGFCSIGADEWLFEMALNAMFLPGAQGKATWKSDKPGERLAIKLPGQFNWIAEKDAQFDESIGKRLAEWARGGPVTKAAKATAPELSTVGAALAKASIIDGDGDLTFADRWDMAVDEATVAADLHRDFSQAMKTAEWDALKDAEPARATALKAKVTRRVSELKVAG